MDMKEVIRHEVMSVQGSSSIYISGETSEYNDVVKCWVVKRFSLYLGGGKKSYFLNLKDNEKKNNYLTKLVNKEEEDY